jgi:hypothetical protein
MNSENNKITQNFLHEGVDIAKEAQADLDMAMDSETYNYSSYTYHRLVTPFGDLWLNPTSGTHIYADANHNCLSENIPVRPDGDRCAPLTVNRVAYGATIHFYLWADGHWHIGMEFDKDGNALNSYARRQSLYMSKLHHKSYADSHPSFAAVDKVLAGVEAPLNEWCKTHAEVLHNAAVEDARKRVETLKAEIAEVQGELVNRERRLEDLKWELAKLTEEAG